MSKDGGSVSLSPLMKAALFLCCIIIVVHIVGFSTPFLRVEGVKNEGIWETCIFGICTSVTTEPVQSAGWFITNQVNQALGLLIGLAVFIVTRVLVCVHRTTVQNKMILSLVILSCLSGIQITSGLIVYGANASTFFPAFTLGFSFYLLIAAASLYFTVTILMVTELSRRQHIPCISGKPKTSAAPIA